MDMAGMEAFLAIVKTRNLTKAAQLLHLSQSTISYRLQVLEREMGGCLIERKKGTQTVALSPLGETFIPLAERWEALTRDVTTLQSSGPQITISVGAADSFNVYVLPPLYRRLAEEYPFVRLRIRTQHTAESYESMERREVDVAFVKLERSLPNVIVEPFFVDEMVLVRLAAPGRSAQVAVSPRELDSAAEIYFNWGPSYELWHDRWWDVYKSARLQVDAAALIPALLHDPRQWAIAPQSVIRSFTGKGDYVSQRLTEPPPPRTGYMLLHKHPDNGRKDMLATLARMVRQLYDPGVN